MTRRALAAALLAVFIGAPLAADLGGNRATYLARTEQGLIKETPGRLNTWNFSALSFTPEGPGVKPLTIPYKSIKELEYGRTPGRRGWAPPGSLVTKPHYLTIVYTEPEPRIEETAARKKQRKKEEEQELTLEQEREKRRKERDEAREREKEKKTDAIAVFELGHAILRPTLRILESRTGKRIHYQDAEARRSAR
jgi:hypothetical protein